MITETTECGDEGVNVNNDKHNSLVFRKTTLTEVDPLLLSHTCMRLHKLCPRTHPRAHTHAHVNDYFLIVFQNRFHAVVLFVLLCFFFLALSLINLLARLSRADELCLSLVRRDVRK